MSAPLHRENGRGSSDEPPAQDGRDAANERELQLEWLRTYPGYRALIRERVSEARKRQLLMDERVARQHADVDYLGRGVDGCG